MRADRLITILMILKNRKDITTRELVKELGVSERTIHRDMEALSSAGIPIYSERGKNGGWKLIDGWTHKLSWLKNSELESLFIPYSDQLLLELGHYKDVSQARNKLLASLEAEERKATIQLWDRVYIDSTSWRGPTNTKEFFSEIKASIFAEKRLKIQYRKFNGEKDERVIDPIGLVAKADKWYLIAIKNGAYRNYRISRIESIEVMDETFAYPQDFNLKDYWETSKQQFIKTLPRFVVEIEAAKSILERLSFTGRFVEIIKTEHINEAWIPIQLNFDSEQEAIEYILGFGTKIRILKPEYLRDQITKEAKAIIGFYKS